MSLYIATYDISDNWRRTRVAKVLRSYGRRLQLSVFEVWVEREELPVLRRRLGSLLRSTDALELVPIDEHPARTRLCWEGSSGSTTDGSEHMPGLGFTRTGDGGAGTHRRPGVETGPVIEI